MAIYRYSKNEKLTEKEKKDWYFLNKDNSNGILKDKISEEIESLNVILIICY